MMEKEEPFTRKFNILHRTVQAFYSFLVGYIVCKSTCSKSFVYASHFLMEAYGWFGTAYFMYDIWSMYKVHTQKIADKLKMIRTNQTDIITKTSNAKDSDGNNVNAGQSLFVDHSINRKRNLPTGEKLPLSNGTDGTSIESKLCHIQEDISGRDDINSKFPKSSTSDFLRYMLNHPVMMIHHIFIGTFGLLVVTYIRGGGHCIYSYMFMMEFSTPFVSLRSILSTMRLKESQLYILNGLSMLATFFVCRVFMWPYVMWRYSVAIDSGFVEAFVNLPVGCIASILILFLPQIYWFYLMVKGALKVFFPVKVSDKQLYTQSKNNNLSPILLKGSLEFLQYPVASSATSKKADIFTAALNTTTPILDMPPIDGKG